MSDPGPATGTASPVTGRGPAPARRGWRWVPVLFAFLVETLAVAPVGPLPFYLTPLVLGLTYLAAAAVGGRHATLWAPGLVISAWGVAVVLVFSETVHTDFASVAVTALGVGATAAALLGRAGVRVDALAVGLSVLLAGLTELAASLGVDVLGRGWFYGALLGVWVLADLSLRSCGEEGVEPTRRRPIRPRRGPRLAIEEVHHDTRGLSRAAPAAGHGRPAGRGAARGRALRDAPAGTVAATHSHRGVGEHAARGVEVVIGEPLHMSDSPPGLTQRPCHKVGRATSSPAPPLTHPSPAIEKDRARASSCVQDRPPAPTG